VSKIDKGRAWENLWGRSCGLPCREVPCLGDLQYCINLNNIQSGTVVLSGNNLRLFRCPSFISPKTPFEKLEIRHEPFLISLDRKISRRGLQEQDANLFLHRWWGSTPNSDPLKIGDRSPSVGRLDKIFDEPQTGISCNLCCSLTCVICQPFIVFSTSPEGKI